MVKHLCILFWVSSFCYPADNAAKPAGIVYVGNPRRVLARHSRFLIRNEPANLIPLINPADQIYISQLLLLRDQRIDAIKTFAALSGKPLVEEIGNLKP